MYPYHIISPAYGRDYKSAKAAIADFEANKDFIHEPSGKLCSIRDFTGSVEIRYGNMRKLVIYHIKKD